MRINKHIASLGIATRKDADILVEKGLVMINGRRAVLGDKVGPTDTVAVRHHTAKTYRYFAYHKPIGVMTHSPQYGEKDITSSVPIQGVFPVGRLDKRSSGLIILTDDARITDRLLSPKYAHDKEYRVDCASALPRHFKEMMECGVDIGGYITKPCTVELRGEKSFLITLTEGKKHQIRRMCDALKAPALKLERVRILNIKLGNLKPNAYRTIEGIERERFLKTLGL